MGSVKKVFTTSLVSITLLASGGWVALWAQGRPARAASLPPVEIGAITVSDSPTPIPEPLMILGTALAVGVGALLRRQYLAKHTPNPDPPDQAGTTPPENQK